MEENVELGFNGFDEEPSIEKNTFIARLQRSDEASLHDRANRLESLNIYQEINFSMLTGDVSMYYCNEAMTCYINGSFVACIVLVAAVLEEVLRGFFHRKGTSNNKADSFKSLIIESRNAGYISRAEAEDLHTIRNLRNPYVHPKSRTDPKSLSERAIVSQTHPLVIVQADAEKALLMSCKFLKRKGRDGGC